MAVEGGGAYRQSLIRSKNRRDELAKVRKKNTYDPMAWTREKHEDNIMRGFFKSAKNAGFAPSQYRNMLIKAYGDEGKPGIGTSLQGMVTSTGPTVNVDELQGKDLIPYTQGRNLEGLMGNEVGLDTLIKRSQTRTPYKITFNKNQPTETYYTDTQFGDNVSPEMFLRDVFKGLATDFATSADKLVRGTTDIEDTSKLWTFGGLLANEAEFAAQSRRGDKSGARDDILNAINLGSYALGGARTLGAGKVAGQVIKNAGKGAIQTNRGRAATGTALSLGLLTAGAVKPQDAEAFSYSKMAKLLKDGNQAAVNKYARDQAKKITKRARERRWQELVDEGVVSGEMPRGRGWYNDPKYAGLGLDEVVTRQDVIAQAKDFIRVYGDTPLGKRLGRAPMSGPNSGTLHWGHDKPLSSGGRLQEGGLIPANTNLSQGTRTFDDLIDEKIAAAATKGITLSRREAALELGILPAYDKSMLRTIKRAG